MFNAITDVPGIMVGHFTDLNAATGCTVILCEGGAVAGVDVRGGAPGTRDTDLLNPVNVVEKIHAVMLSGGSAFGLNSIGGVQRYLEEKGIGYEMAGVRVPIVPGAVVFDLDIGNAGVRPGADEGYKACRNATSGPIVEGCVGAGAGAMIGQLKGKKCAMKGGLGTASLKFYGEVVVAALIIVNALGDIIDPASGRIMAGIRHEDGRGLDNTIELMKQGYTFLAEPGRNTVVGVVATNAVLTKAQAAKVAGMAHDGLARSINPSHSMHDGDTIFALSLGDRVSDVTSVGSMAAEVTRMAIVNAVKKATSLDGVPSIDDFPQ
ncbi:MAG: P1 family peptidase [Dehalococcoidia bacterium]